MRKLVIVLAMAVSLLGIVTVPVGAADLHEPHQGTACAANEIGTWHFVNNQTEGLAGVLVVEFDTGVSVFPPSKVNRSVNHYNVVGQGNTLIDASTPGVPGRLVLSDFSCEPGKKSNPK